jgi:hypothetical protein
MIESKTTGLTELLESLDGIQRTPGRVSAACTAEGSRPDGGVNVVVARSQAKQGRNPFFLDASEDAAGNAIVLRMVEAWERQDLDGAMQRSRELAELMVAAAKRHIAEQRGEGGAFKPLSPRYAAIKKYKHRAGDKPILVNTGALLESITPKVSVRPGRG